MSRSGDRRVSQPKRGEPSKLAAEVAGKHGVLRTPISCELSVAVGRSEAVALRDLVVPIANGFIG
jgi:hypothetical protein